MSLNEASLERALHGVHFPGGLSASVMEGEFGGSRFTRDYLAMMSDLMDSHPNIVREGFSMIPQEQGVDFDPLTDQQPDRLPHQVAYNQWSGLVIPQNVIEGKRYWTGEWGVPFDEEKGFTVWNQTDGSRYIHELATFVSKYGSDVLNDRYVHQPTGEVRTVREAALRQLDWMTRTIENSDLGLLEVAETNPRQTSWSGVMRDGYDSYFHETASGLRVPVNKDKPIAYLESQGLAVQAFSDALKLFDDREDGELQARRAKWQEILHDLPDRVFEHFRWDEENSLVPAVDRDENGNPRQVRLMSSVLGETLATPEFYTGINDKTFDRNHLIGSIATVLYSDEFMTPAGIRMLGRRHQASQGPVSAYQGPDTVWPVTQWRTADGFEAVNMHGLAEDLRLKRTLGALSFVPDEYPEIWYLTKDGDVAYKLGNEGEQILAEQLPSRGQGWTLTGAIKALRTAPTTKVTQFESGILKKVPRKPALDYSGQKKSPPEFSPYTVNVEEAKRIKAQERAA